MQQRIDAGDGDIGVGREIGLAVEAGRGLAAELRAEPEIMFGGIDAERGDIGILRQIPGGVEQLRLPDGRDVMGRNAGHSVLIPLSPGVPAAAALGARPSAAPY